jgi:hypothetical protein
MQQMRISTTQVSSVMLRSKKLEIRKTERAVGWKPNSAMKLSKIRRRIELCLREIILRSEINLYNLLFLDSSIHIRILKQVPKFLATGL